MSILIKGMEMPKEGRLTLQISAYGGVYVINSCNITAETYMTDAVSVPPHGRLIDADALITTFCEWGTRLERGWKLTITMAEAKHAIVEIIEDAPTIIEADEVSE